MNTSEDKLSLVNIRDGSAVELFDAELEKVAEDMLDPNKDRAKPRTVTLTVTFKPHPQDKFAAIGVSCRSTLAPVQSVAGTVVFGREGRAPVMRELVQQELFAENKANVVPMERREREGGETE
jgi:hypothetical protein